MSDSDSIKELFVSIFGGPQQFSMDKCPVREETRQFIRRWGGEMTETKGPHTIHLVSKGEEAPKTGDSFHVQYIYDCITKERLLLVDKYRVNKNSCYAGNITAMEVMLQKASWSDCQLKGNDLSPSSADPGPSRYYPGHSSADPGPSRYHPGPSSPVPGPSSADPGPSSPDPGPSSPDPGPSSPDPGPARRFRKYMYLRTRSTEVKFINVEERQEPHVIFPGKQKCLNSSEPVPVNLPTFIHGTGRCENAMPEGFQPLDVDYREDESTDLCTESDSEEEGMVQLKLELESEDSRVDVCEETQASELQDHIQREPKNDELITIIPETRDFDNVENLEDASESGESTSIEEYASPLKDDNTEAPIQKDSSDVDSSPEERQISYMATGQSKTKHRSVKYPKRALHEQYSTSPEEKNRQPRKRFQPLKNKKRSRFACDMSSPQNKIVMQRSISTNPDGNHVLQGALSVKPTRTTKRAASPLEKRKKPTKLYDMHDMSDFQSEEEYCLPTIGSKLGDQKRNEKSPRKIKNDPSPSSADVGPWRYDPSPSSADPGPSSADPGPSRYDPGPWHYDPSPSSADPGSSSPDPGPSSPDPGPARRFRNQVN